MVRQLLPYIYRASNEILSHGARSLFRSKKHNQPVVTISSGQKVSFTFKTHSADEVRDLVTSQLELLKRGSKVQNENDTRL